jgi:hypothetical protein
MATASRELDGVKVGLNRVAFAETLKRSSLCTPPANETTNQDAAHGEQGRGRNCSDEERVRRDQTPRARTNGAIICSIRAC